MASRALSALPSTHNLVRNVNRKIASIQRDISTETDRDKLKTTLDELITICSCLDSVINEVGEEYWTAISQRIQQIEVEINDKLQHVLESQVSSSAFSLPRRVSNRCGRRKIVINRQNLEKLLSIGFSVRSIAKSGLLGEKRHRNTLSNFIKEENVSLPTFSNTSDNELRSIIRGLHQQFPNSGYREMQKLLKNSIPPLLIQRERVRILLKEVDPIGSAQRYLQVIHRRIYSVSTRNALWHLDSHHKIRLF